MHPAWTYGSLISGPRAIGSAALTLSLPATPDHPSTWFFSCFIATRSGVGGVSPASTLAPMPLRLRAAARVAAACCAISALSIVGGGGGGGGADGEPPPNMSVPSVEHVALAWLHLLAFLAHLTEHYCYCLAPVRHLGPVLAPRVQAPHLEFVKHLARWHSTPPRSDTGRPTTWRCPAPRRARCS